MPLPQGDPRMRPCDEMRHFVHFEWDSISGCRSEAVLFFQVISIIELVQRRNLLKCPGSKVSDRVYRRHSLSLGKQAFATVFGLCKRAADSPCRHSISLECIVADDTHRSIQSAKGRFSH
jgi:hypothetical protein